MQPGNELSKYGVELPESLWRVSLKRYAPFTAPPAKAQIFGRFDDPSPVDETADSYAVIYCAISPKVAFIEALAGLRNRIGVRKELLSNTLIAVDEREPNHSGRTSAGIVTANWQSANQLTSGRISTLAPLLDLTNAAAVQALRFHLAPSLIALGMDDLDFGDLLSTNRALSQAISRWIWTMTDQSEKPLFAGIRYRSRFDPECICLALYEERFSIDGHIDIQPITPTTPGFAEAASILRLEIS